MKVLMLSHYFPSHRGGIENIAKEMFDRLTAAGQQVVWLAADVSPAPDPVQFSYCVPLPVWNFLEQRTGLPLPIPRLASLKTIRRQVRMADVLLLHDCLYISNIFAFALAKLLGVPVIINQHIGAVPYRKWLLRSAMTTANAIVTRSMLSQAEQVVFESERPRSFFGSLSFRAVPDVLFNGVDTNLYRTLGEKESRPAIRRKWGLPEHSTVVLFVGRFVEKKGLRILRHMAVMRPAYTWVLAGWGPIDPSAWSLPNVRVLSGLAGDPIATLYRVCDALVLPSTGEGFPLVVQEALASGLPVVCSAETLEGDPQLAELARGIPIRKGNDNRTALDFVSALDELLTSETTASSRRRREFASCRYSWDRTVQRYLEIASRLTHGSPTSIVTAPAKKVSQ